MLEHRIKLTRESELEYDVVFRLPRAADTQSAELGDPMATTDYVLCVYHTVGGQPTLIAAEPAFSQTFRDGVPCWTATSAGFKFRNRSGRISKLRKILVKAGLGGKASAKAIGSLSTMYAPAQSNPLGLPLAAQIVSPDACCSATLTAATENAAGG